MEAPNNAIIKAGDAIKNSKWIIFTSGAGLGVDSGLPDFRGDTGFWKAYPPMKDLGLQFQQMSTPHWFKSDPTFAWGFWAHRYNLYSTTKPNHGFNIMKRIAEEKERSHGGYFCVTSNVDGQWQKAGFPEEKIFEIHGSIHYLQCQDVGCCGKEESEREYSGYIWPVENFNVSFDLKTFRAQPPLPTCIHCSGIARPNVLMFGDGTWHDYRWSEQNASYNSFTKEIASAEGVAIIEVGAGLAVPSIRHKGEHLARKYDGTLIRINPRDTDLPPGEKHVSLPMGGLAALQKISELLWK